MDKPSCPICDGSSSSCFSAGDMRMYRCHGCGSAFVSPMPSAEFLARFYSQFHGREADDGGYRMEEKMVAKHPFQVGLVKRSMGDRVGRLLDVGCGKGYFVQVAVKSGIDAEGVELSDTGVEYATSRLGLKVLQGTIEALQDVVGTFDAVTLWGVIEHLSDPMSTLRAIHHVLRPGGGFFLQTGIGNDWLDRLLPGVNQWYDPPLHLWVFSCEGVRRALDRAGFDTVRIDRFSDYSVPRRVARVLRNGVTAALLRGAAEAGRLGGRDSTKFALGSEMSVIARKR